MWGNCRGGACHQPTIDRLVKAIVGHFENSHPLLKKMIEGSDYPVIFWGDMGPGGLRSLHAIFREKKLELLSWVLRIIQNSIS